MQETTLYAPRFKIADGCLAEIRMTRSGYVEKKLCNFVPYLTEEITLDDGVETKSRIKLRGTHQNGRELPEIEIAGSELPSFNWLPDHWGMDCILEVDKNTKELVRYAIQTTADHAERKTVYTVTGWKKIAGQWEFLLPGDDAHTVKLPGKLHGFQAEAKASAEELSLLRMLLTNGPAEKEILLPLLALTFLSPLNHFLAMAECEPKFVLFLIGKTGSRKSTLAALMLSFFGRFTATELPMSFQDTAYSILYHAFSLKDVLTCMNSIFSEPVDSGLRQLTEHICMVMLTELPKLRVDGRSKRRNAVRQRKKTAPSICWQIISTVRIATVNFGIIPTRSIRTFTFFPALTTRAITAAPVPHGTISGQMLLNRSFF